MIVEKISSRQFTWLIIAVGISTPTMMLPAEVIFYAKQSSWLAILLGTLAAAAGVLLNLALARQFPGLTLAQYAQTLLGTWLGRFIGIFYGLTCLLISALALSSFARLITISAMQETPLWAFVLGLTLLAVYAAWQGIEPVARANDLVLPFSLLGLVIIFFLALRQGELYRALPVLQFQFGEIVTASFIPFGYLGESFFILLLAPAINQAERLKSASLKGVILTGLILILITQTILFVMGSYRASAYIFPLLRIAEELMVMDFLERLEAVLLALWLTITSIKLSLFAYCFALSTSQAMGWKSYRPTLLFSLLAIPAIALAPKSLAEFRAIWSTLVVHKTLVPIALFVLPGLLLIIAKVKKQHA